MATKDVLVTMQQMTDTNWCISPQLTAKTTTSDSGHNTLLYVVEFQTGVSIGKITGRQGHTQGGAKGLEAPPGSPKVRLVVI